MSEATMPSATERFIRGILPENPTYRQMLGMCPTLATTAAMDTAITMALATTFVLVASNAAISLMRNVLVDHLRILIYTVTIAAFVTVADLFLAAQFPELSEDLGPYVPLIIVNCIIIGRAEVVAAKQGLLPSLADGLGQGLGFLLGLSSLAIIREILGNGTLLGFAVMPEAFPRWLIMVMPPGAFLTFGILMGLINWLSTRKPARPAAAKVEGAAEPVEVA